MKYNDLKIGNQMIIGFGAMLALVITLGIVSFIQSNQIHQQTEIMYTHPLQINKAVAKIEVSILKMRVATRDLSIARSDKDKRDAVQDMELSESQALREFKLLYERYTGPKKDIDEAYDAFNQWITVREINNTLAQKGKYDQIIANVRPDGLIGKYRLKLTEKIEKIKEFENKRSETLYSSSNKLIDLLQLRLVLLVIGVILVMLIIYYWLMRNIKRPIAELTNVTTRFSDGDLDARSSLMLRNEFGILSNAFNEMVERIKQNFILTQQTAALADSMLIEEDAHLFFQTLLPTLSEFTNSQMAAVYLLSSDKKNFEYFESIGMNLDGARQSFSVNGYEGEFGSVMKKRKIQSIKSIPIDTRFVFQTVSGKFIPREIVTIPILSGSEIIAIISLASVRKYSDLSNKLIESIFDVLTARIEGVLTYRKLKDSSFKLETQNIELEAQKAELASQSTVLIEQNIELEIQKNQLNEANRLKTNFLSNMSHELRTPLNSVIALSGVLHRKLENKIPEDEYSYLEVIERNGKHLLSLINDILDIARIESGREEIEITKFNANNLISEIFQMINPQAEQKKIKLIHADAETEILINSDRTKCHHILQNLVANAVKFTEKGKVEILASLEKNNLKIVVSDTGIGISKSHILHIFDEFRQADGSTSRRFGGTGLGLAIVKKYANLLGGAISVKSEPGSGSEFTLTLPLIYNDENNLTEINAELVVINQNIASMQYNTQLNKTILLVEDSEPAVIQLNYFMEESGYNIIVARDGNEALDVISQTIPDAIIMDLMMPGVDGFQVLQSIREAELTAKVPVLILTAKQLTKEDLKFLKRNNVHQLIQKGDVNRTELLNSISTMVASQSTNQVPQKQIMKPDIEKPTVLIVEDNVDNMLTIKVVLEKGFNVIEAQDGAHGVLQAINHLPDLILMDLALPGLDGIQAFKKIRTYQQLADIPVIALTASAMIYDRETILSHGFDAYLAKPIDEKVFFKTINEVLYGK